MITRIDPAKLPYDPLIQGLCKTPFYGHSKGCPNHGKKEGCPPQQTIEKMFDLDRPMYLIATEYTVGKFAEKMRREHPDWKERTYPDDPKRSGTYVADIEERLRANHPGWPRSYFPSAKPESWVSCRSWYNPRRWQPQARKEHKEELTSFLAKEPAMTIDSCPEAHGVNLTGLMHQHGIALSWEWPPAHDERNITYLISIAGYTI